MPLKVDHLTILVKSVEKSMPFGITYYPPGKAVVD